MHLKNKNSKKKQLIPHSTTRVRGRQNATFTLGGFLRKGLAEAGESFRNEATLNPPYA